jgi:hypothetical protein
MNEKKTQTRQGQGIAYRKGLQRKEIDQIGVQQAASLTRLYTETFRILQMLTFQKGNLLYRATL